LTLVAVIARFGEERLGLLWRDTMTRGILRRYLTDGTYQRLNVSGTIANPAGRKLAEMDLVEINEAFAAQVLACLKGLGWDERDRLNVNGSGISLGHPIGATGVRIMTTLMHEMRRWWWPRPSREEDCSPRPPLRPRVHVHRRRSGHGRDFRGSLNETLLRGHFLPNPSLSLGSYGR
jgi:hypothetical protein